MFFELFIVLRSLSVLWTLGFAALCLAQLPNPLRVLSKTQPREAEAMGYGLLGMGGIAAIRASTLYTLRFTL